MSQALTIARLEDVPRARRFVAERLSPTSNADVIDSAQLVTTELVTNALLHAQPPISLHVHTEGDRARVEVEDGSTVAPAAEVAGNREEEMTGRGLALVAALADRWGTRRTDNGKVVWCDLSLLPGQRSSDDLLAGPELDELLQEWDDELGLEFADVQASPSLHLGSVPVDLLLAAESHVDDLVRDLTLAAASGTRRVPQELVRRMEAAVSSFGEERRRLRQAATAARRIAQEEADLVLPLRPGIVSDGLAFLDALAEADAYSRASRLLAMEQPVEHRVLHSWVVDQLAAAQAGNGSGESDSAASETRPVRQAFRDRLLDELGRLANFRRIADRATRLYAVASRLAAARTPEQVAEAALSEGLAALAAARARLLMLTDGHLSLVGQVGSIDSASDAALHDIPVTEALPSAQAARTGEPVWLESSAERDRRFPLFAQREPATRALFAVPLNVGGGRCLGVLRFTFDVDIVVSDDEREFVLALAAQTASALDRSMAYASEHAARQQAETVAGRLARLQDVTARLTAARDPSAVADVVMGHARDALGAVRCSLSLIDTARTGTAEPVQLLPGEAPRQELVMVATMGVPEETNASWRRFPLDADLPASEAVRTNQPVLVSTVKERDARYPLLATLPHNDEHALVVMPLSVEGRALGALTLSFPAPHRPSDADLSFLSALADACSQALDRTEAMREAAAANERLAFLAEASVELSSSLDYATTLTRVAQLAVSRLADWCAVSVSGPNGPENLAVAHIDPAKVDLAHELERRYPPDPEHSAVHRIFATGESELYPVVTDEQIAATAQDEEHANMLAALGGLRSVMMVPMNTRGRTVGVLSLLSSTPGRFGPADLSLAEDLARRAAVAVDNAALFRDLSSPGQA